MSHPMPSTTMLSVSLFPTAEVTRPFPAEVAWPDGFLDHEEVPDKESQPLWSPATYPEGSTSRHAPFVTSLSALVLDFDYGSDIERAALAWAAWEFVLYTSFRHTSSEHRFRLVLPLARPATPAEHAALWAEAKLRSPEIDAKCSDPSRIWYGPIRAAGAPHLALHHDPGLRLPVPEVAPKAAPGTPGPAGPRRLFKGIDAPRPVAQVEDPDAIEGACAWMAYARDNAADLSEPEWYAQLSILARCKDGDTLAHTRSAPYAGYSPAETEAKLARAKAVGPTTCDSFRKLGGLDGPCSGCNLSCTSPVSLGRPSRVGQGTVDDGAGDQPNNERERAWVVDAEAKLASAQATLEVAKHNLRTCKISGTETEVAEFAEAKAHAHAAVVEAKAELKAARKAATAAPPPEGEADVLDVLDMNPQDNRPRPTKGNIRHVLTLDPAYTSLAWDSFGTRLLLHGEPLADAGVTDIATTLEYDYRLIVPTPLVGEVMLAVASKNAIHPVRDYLNEQEWDGTPRVRDLLLRGFGAVVKGVTTEAWLSTVSERFLVSAVARVMQPGCKVDTMLVLTGPQGAGKSRGLRTLAGDDWFSDTNLDIAGKDGVIQMRGKWLYELSELDSFRRVEATKIKAFLSSQGDNVRLPYAKNATFLPRETVLVGTTNHESMLNDPTGSRRFLVAQVGQVDVMWIADNRDQIWAEALVLYQRGHRWWFDEQEVVTMRGINEEYRERDPWEEHVHAVLAARGWRKASMMLLATEVLRKEPGDVSKADRARIADVMRALGCDYVSDGEGTGTYSFIVPERIYAGGPLTESHKGTTSTGTAGKPGLFQPKNTTGEA